MRRNLLLFFLFSFAPTTRRHAMTFSLQRRTAIAALAALGLGAALTAFAPLAAAQSVADIKKKGEITIGMLVDLPPTAPPTRKTSPTAMAPTWPSCWPRTLA